MKITTEFEGLEDLQRKIVEIGGDKLLRDINKRIIKEGQEQGAKLAKPSLPKSKDHAGSGPLRKVGVSDKTKIRKTPQGHAADNIPIGDITTSRGQASGTIGWAPDDTSEHFYEKFPIYGVPGHIEAQVGFEQVEDNVQRFIDRMGEAEYLRLLKEAIE